MTAWLITIGKDYPQHLQYALEKGYWDFANERRTVPVVPGDRLAFRYGGGSVAGVFEATSGPISLVGDDGHYILQDREPRWDTPKDFLYFHRVFMDPLSVTPTREISTGEIRAVLNAKGDASYMFQSPTRFEGDAESLLLGAFDIHGVDAWPIWDGPELGDGVTHMDRPKRLAWMASRVGQEEFRERLIKHYGGKCALTGTTAIDALEAAHIIEWNAGGVNDVWNGILLRADVHRLFDKSLIRIRSRNRVEIDQRLAGTEYALLKKLAGPVSGAEKPARHAMLWRWEKKNGRAVEEF